MGSRDTEVLVHDGLLMGLQSRFGRNPEWQDTVAWLKLARASELAVASSVLEFLDATGRVLCSYPSAFGLAAGAHWRGPYAQRLNDERPFPPLATLQRWRLNGHEVCGPVAAPRTALRCTYLPLQVPLADDPHLLFRLENQTERPLNVADAMRSAVCWVDGAPFGSAAAALWNGLFIVAPGRVMSRHFCLADFPGAPRSGVHEMSLELAGLRSPAQVVEWTGEPWREPGPP